MKRSAAIAMRDSLKASFSDWLQTATISDGAVNTYNPATGTTTTTYGTTATGSVYLRDYSSEQIAGEILAGDVEILWFSGTPEIKPNAKITVGTTTYNVINASPVTKSQGIIQRLQCRGINA